MTVYPSYNPTPLVAGDLKLVSRPILVAAGQNAAGTVLPRGTVLGQRATDTAAAAVKASGANTGNGTITLDAVAPIQPNARPGTYQVRFTAPAAFRVSDPHGEVLGDGAPGQAFADQVKFQIAAGATAFVVGDGFDIAVSGTGKCVVSVATATDGSQVPAFVTTDDLDTSASDVPANGYVQGEFAWELANVDPSWTLATLNAALASRNSLLIFLQVGVTA